VLTVLPEGSSLPPRLSQTELAIYDIDILTPEGTITLTMAKDRNNNNTVTFQKVRSGTASGNVSPLSKSQTSLGEEFQYPAEEDSAYRQFVQSETHKIIVGKHITVIDIKNESKSLLKNHTADVRCVRMTNKRFFTG